MESLPRHLLDEIFLRLDLKSLAMLKCTKRSLYLHISFDPYLRSEYNSRVKSGLLHVSIFCTRLLYYHSLGDSRPQRTINILKECQILGSCSGLLLLYVGGLCVAQPLTKKFRFLSQHSLRSSRYIGLAVHQIDHTTNTKSFKVVYMKEETSSNKTTYRFEINAGNSWKLSESSITCGSSQLDNLSRRPVYFDRYLHWLRSDGSIIAFNPETEQSQVITIKFPQNLSSRNLFAAGDNSLTLISATNEVIDVYALENTLTDPKWVLVKQIRNGVLNKKSQYLWKVAAYDGKCLVLREYLGGRVLHGYDLRANKWEVIGSVSEFCNMHRDFFQFTPSSYSVIELYTKEEEEMLASDDRKKSISDVRSIMGLVIDGVSLENGKGTSVFWFMNLCSIVFSRFLYYFC